MAVAMTIGATKIKILQENALASLGDPETTNDALDGHRNQSIPDYRHPGETKDGALNGPIFSLLQFTTFQKLMVKPSSGVIRYFFSKRATV